MTSNTHSNESVDQARGDDVLGAPEPERTDQGGTAAKDPEQWVTGDDGRLRQVVANLVSNALVHTDAGVPVHLAVATVEDRVVLEVSDAGPGMEASVAEQAFERFYRADPSRVRARGGTGLGLAITESLVHAHGGAVSLRTAPGQGTTVRVEIPAGPTPEGLDR